MENSQNNNSPDGNEPKYPDPIRDVLATTSQGVMGPYGSFPGTSSFGAFLGPATSTPAAFPPPHAGTPGPSAYGGFPGSQHQLSPTEHHVTDFRAFTDPQNGNGPLHLASRLAQEMPLRAPQQLTEVQRLAAQFQLRHGDPGARYSEETSSHSTLAGRWGNDESGGRAAARRAYAAAQIGSRRAYDPDFRQALGLYNESFDDGDLRSMGIPAPSPAASESTRGSATRRRGRGGWRKLLKGTEHEKVGSVSRASSGRSRASGPRPRGGRKKQVDPGPEFKTFMNKANQARLDGDVDAALDYARQAVGANPEIYVAHSLVSDLLRQRGDLELSVHTLWVGAQSARTVEAWTLTAERILELDGDNPSWARLRSAIDCYAEALKLHTYFKYDKELEFEVRARKFELYKELNDSRGARMDCRAILKQWPKKSYYLNEYARLCAAWGDASDLTKAKEAYDHAFDLYQDEPVFGEVGVDPTDQWSHLNIYLEVVHDLGIPWEGIIIAKRIARRFLGRKHETFWDQYKADDREFDEDDDRRNLVVEFQTGRASRDVNQYGLGLPIEIKVRLGLMRVKCGMHCYDEALKHFRPLLKYGDWAKEYWEPFQQAATCLRGAGFMKEAAEYYDCLRKLGDRDDDRDEILDDTTWIQIATCYQALGRTDDAIACYELVRLRKGSGYVKVCAKLAKLYEDGGKIDQARFLCTELINLNRRDLLMDAGVKMVPPSARAPPPKHVAILKPSAAKPTPAVIKPKPSVPLRVLKPNGVPNILPSGQGSFTDFQLGGPVSAPVTLPQVPDVPDEDAVETPKKRRRRRRNKNGAVDDDDLQDGDNGQPAVKRPKLRKPLKPKEPSKRDLRFQEFQDAETRCRVQFGIIQMHWHALKDRKDEEAVEQWVDAANSMLNVFSSMKVFFPEKDKGMKLHGGPDPGKPFMKESKRVSLSAPEAFLSIPLSEWHHIFVDLAIVYANSGEQERCYRVLKDVILAANVFYQNEDTHWISNAVALYCGFTFNDSEYLISLARQILAKNNFMGGMAFQLLAAVNRFAYGSNWFSAGPTQKFMLRMVKQFDYMVMPPEVRERIDWSIQSTSLSDRVKKLATEPHELDAGILLMYGHMVAVANHSHSALPYYYRALALQPENICVNLSIATMWIQNSMKRQTENRQYGITQGLAFMYRYYDLRVASGKACHRQEAEYNVARTWHQLGLLHLAVPAYEKVLVLSEALRKEHKEMIDKGEEPLDLDAEDFALEAAYALQNIYALGGDQEAARKVTEEWLVI